MNHRLIFLLPQRAVGPAASDFWSEVLAAIEPLRIRAAPSERFSYETPLGGMRGCAAHVERKGTLV